MPVGRAPMMCRLFSWQFVLRIEPWNAFFEEGVHLWLEGFWIVKGVQVQIDLVTPLAGFI